MAFYDPPNNVPLGGLATESIEDNITTVGTIQVGAYPITKAYSILGTVNTGQTAAILPNAPGCEFVIKNNGTATALMFPPVLSAVDGGTVNASVTLAAAATGGYLCVSPIRYVKIR